MDHIIIPDQLNSAMAKTLSFDIEDFEFTVSYQECNPVDSLSSGLPLECVMVNTSNGIYQQGYSTKRLTIKAIHKTDLTQWSIILTNPVINDCYSVLNTLNKYAHFSIHYSLDKFYNLMAEHQKGKLSPEYTFKFIFPQSEHDTLNIQLAMVFPFPEKVKYVDTKEIKLVFIDDHPAIVLNKKLNEHIKVSDQQIKLLRLQVRAAEQQIKLLEQKVGRLEHKEVNKAVRPRAKSQSPKPPPPAYLSKLVCKSNSDYVDHFTEMMKSNESDGIIQFDFNTMQYICESDLDSNKN